MVFQVSSLYTVFAISCQPSSFVCDSAEEVKYEIWDTAGQERYKSLVSAPKRTWRGRDGCSGGGEDGRGTGSAHLPVSTQLVIES